MKTRLLFVLSASACMLSLFSCGEKPTGTPPLPPPSKDKYEVTLSGNELSMGAFNPAAQSVDVTTESKLWKVTAQEEWLTAIKSDGTVTISAQSNLNPQSRKGVVTISGDDVETPVSIEVSQDGIEITLDVSTRSVAFLCTDDSSKSREIFVTSDKGIWQADLASDEYFILSVRDDRVVISPKSVNESEDPRVTTLSVSAGTAAEPIEIDIMQKGVVNYETFLAEWQVSGNPDIWDESGVSSWESTFEPVSSGGDQWFVSWNFGGFEDTYLPLKYTNETLQIDDFMQAMVPQEGSNRRAYVRLLYFDDEDRYWFTLQPLIGKWNGVTKTISFSEQFYDNIDGKMHDIVVVIFGYDLETQALVGLYTDGYTDLTFERDEIIVPGRAAYAPYAWPRFEHPDDASKIEALKAASEKMSGKMTRAELFSKKLR